VNRNLTEIVGWYGVAAILAAYFLNIFGLLVVLNIIWGSFNWDS